MDDINKVIERFKDQKGERGKSMYEAKYNHKDQIIIIKFDANAMRGRWPDYFESGAHEENLNEFKKRIDECIRTAYFSGRIESNISLARDTAASNVASCELTANV